MGLNSCTAGLHLALLAAGVQPGDEVITTPMTFCASANVIEHVGATPGLVDVEPDTLNLDPRAVSAAVTPRTRAILAVHYAGHPADLDPIQDLACQHGLAVMEDAAHALPASYKGRMIGAGAESGRLQLLRHQEPHHRRRRHAHRIAPSSSPGPERSACTA